MSGPAALSGFSFESCFDTPLIVIFRLGMAVGHELAWKDQFRKVFQS